MFYCQCVMLELQDGMTYVIKKTDEDKLLCKECIFIVQTSEYIGDFFNVMLDRANVKKIIHGRRITQE